MRSLIWLSARVLVTLALASGGAVAQAPGDACTALDPNAAILSSGFGLNPSNTRNGVSSITASNVHRRHDADPRGVGPLLPEKTATSERWGWPALCGLCSRTVGDHIRPWS